MSSNLGEQITVELLRLAANGERNASNVLTNFIYSCVRERFREVWAQDALNDAVFEAFTNVITAFRRSKLPSCDNKPLSEQVAQFARASAGLDRIDAWRRHARRPEPAELTDETRDNESAEPESSRIIDLIAKKREIALLREQLKLLDDEDYSLITLHYCLELSHQEIATFLNWSIGTVKSKLNRIRGKLKAALS